MNTKGLVKGMMAVAVACMLATAANAQPQHREIPSAAERAKKQTEQLSKKLTLTADQKAKIEQVNLEMAKQNDSLIKKERSLKQESRDNAMIKMKAQETVRDAKYKEILTSEQYDKYLKEKNDMPGKVKEKMKERSKDSAKKRASIKEQKQQ